MSKAGELFCCVCCSEASPADDARMNRDLRGPVCRSCDYDLKGAEAWLNLKMNNKYHFGIHGCTHNQESRIKKF